MANVYEMLHAVARYDGSATAHKDVVDCLNKHGHNVKKSDQWCTETVMAALYDVGAIGLVGGYVQVSGDLKKHAEKKGIWKAGTSDILPGDILVYGKNGKPNHTEIAIGHNVTVSGNHKEISKDTCDRRSWSGRSIIGRVRPKYDKMPAMDNLQVTIAAVDCILGVYGSGKTREKMLSVFGADNAARIQAEIDRVWDDMDKIIFDMAVYVIAGHAGKDAYRRKRLGNYAEDTQARIDVLYALSGKTVEEATQLVLDNEFGTNAVRKLLLEFCGYDVEKVQAAVNDALKQPENAGSSDARSGSVVSLFRDVARNTKDVDGLQGNCVIFRSGKCGIIADAMRAGALDKIKRELAGLDEIHVFITHPHGDHMSSNVNNLVKAGLVKVLYLQQRSTVASSYRARYDALVKACEKYGTKVVYLKQGDSFACGDIRGKVIFQQADVSTDAVNMKSLCTLFEIAGKKILYCGDHHTGKKESKLEYKEHVDGYISAHHGLFTGDKEKFIAGISPDWIIHAGWKAWPNGQPESDAKVRGAWKVYQKYGNTLSGDVNGRVELKIADGMITANGEKHMHGVTVKYTLNGKTYQKTVHVSDKTTFRKVASMLPAGAKFA